MTDQEPIFVPAPDGLQLAVRDLPGPTPDAPVVLCLHGLTRNGRDFDGLAEVLRRDFRVVAPDQRGRGRSSYDPDVANYNLLTQTQDTWAILDHLGASRCAVVGTSMGALMSIVMANGQPDRIAGLVLNDAGPEVDPRGLARIGGYVGRSGPVRTWEEAADALRAIHGHAYPTYGPDEWLRLARATYVAEGETLRLDYDPDLSKAFAAGGGGGADMWAAFAVLERIPALMLRGALSDILAAETAQAVAERFPKAEVVTVADRGHAPDLNEPDAVAAIQRFLAREDVRARF